MDEEERDTLWCLRLFTMLNLGGTWAVPRNGLIFEKHSLDPPTLLLVNDPYGLSSYQLSELELYESKFGLAGIRITTNRS